jgi:hypothetical protein
MRKPSYPGSLFSELTTWLEDTFDGGEFSGACQPTPDSARSPNTQPHFRSSAIGPV